MFKEIFLSGLCLCATSYADTNAPQPICETTTCESISLVGGASYYDLGKFNSTIWDYIYWDNDKGYSVINTDMMDKFFESICAELKSVQIDQVYLSFAQLSCLDAYYHNDFESYPISTNDIIATQMKVFKDAQNAGTMDPEFNYLKMLVDGFHKYGIKVNLSFGGGNAAAAEYTLTEHSASKLASFLDNYGIDGIDFDIEVVLAEGVVDQLKTFFSYLGKKRQLTITVMMGIQDWPEGCLKDLFDDFGHLFDGVNLMAYSDTTYYLDAVNVTWGFTSWIDVIGKKNAHKICVGFFDQVPYEAPDDRSERGEKAAGAYLKLVSDLKNLDYPTNFRAPFWWPAEEASYNHYTHAKDGSVTFISADQDNFYQALGQ